MKNLRHFCQLIFSMVFVVMALSVTAAAADTAPHNPPIDPIKPINLNDTPAGEYLAQLMFGQEVHARDGATYYESADLAGSGRQGTSNNVYTEKLYIAGFAQVNAEDNLVAYECYLRDYISIGDPAPDFVTDCISERELFIATYTPGFTTGSVGWFSVRDLDWTTGSLEYITPPAKDPSQDIYYYNPEPDQPPEEEQDHPNNLGPDGGTIISPIISLSEEVTPQDVAGAIADSSNQGEKVALILDASGSVSDYSAAIAAYADQVDNAESIIVFAEDAIEIEAGQYNEVRHKLGSCTDIYNALNLLPDEAFDQVLLVTDTLHNSDWYWFSTSSINQRDNIAAITILNPSDRKNIHLLDYIEQQWGITPTMIHLNPDGTAETEA